METADEQSRQLAATRRRVQELVEQEPELLEELEQAIEEDPHHDALRREVHDRRYGANCCAE